VGVILVLRILIATYHGPKCGVEIYMARKRKDHLYEGWLYHRLADPALLRVRRLVRTQVDAASSLIDIGCGTGELLISMAEWCSELAGVESSKRMWSYATSRVSVHSFDNVEIIYGDGARLGRIPSGTYDYATACMVFHEMEEDRRTPVLLEMQRLARTLILVDYRVPPPTNLAAKICHLVERLAGRRHYRNFSSFLSRGGLPPLLEELGLSVEEEISFHRQCFQLMRTA
jgi:SAM-dependent methyltransferase